MCCIFALPLSCPLPSTHQRLYYGEKNEKMPWEEFFKIWDGFAQVYEESEKKILALAARKEADEKRKKAEEDRKLAKATPKAGAAAGAGAGAAGSSGPRIVAFGKDPSKPEAKRAPSESKGGSNLLAPPVCYAPLCFSSALRCGVGGH